MVYLALCQAILMYGLIVWGSAYKNVLEPLNIIHRMLIRIIMKRDYINRNLSTNDLFQKLHFNKEMIKAKNLIGQVEGIYYKKYNGEILYNVLMETHNKMIINDVIVETLDPNNIVAKLHDGSLNLKERNTIIASINQYANYCKKEYSKLR
jgi:hypothetical protein